MRWKLDKILINDCTSQLINFYLVLNDFGTFTSIFTLMLMTFFDNLNLPHDAKNIM